MKQKLKLLVSKRTIQMKQKLELLVSKRTIQMKQKLKLLVSKRAIFTYVSYPLIFFVANKLTQLFMAANIKAEERDYYGYLALLISVVAIFLFLTEGFKKIYSYSLQGEKLKIRVSEGISVKEMNESKK